MQAVYIKSFGGQKGANPPPRPAYGPDRYYKFVHSSIGNSKDVKQLQWGEN